MNVRKFHASTTREALRQVRDALGADAIILSNRQVAGGIEIMAVADMDVSSLAGNPVNPAPAKARPAPAESFARAEPASSPAPTAASSPISRSQIAELQDKSKPAPVETESKAQPDLMTQEIIREIKFLRGMLEGQLSGFAWGELQRGEPAKIEALRHLLSVGFSPLLSRQLLDKMPAGYDLEKSLR